MYSIGKFSQLTGLTRRALRFYETKGLIVSEKRGDNKYRYYSEEDRERVLKIQFFKKLGFSLEEVKEILNILEEKELLSELERVMEYRMEDCINEISKMEKQKNDIKNILEMLKNYRTVSLNDLEKIESLDKKERSNIMKTLRMEYVSKTIKGKRETNEDRTMVKETDQGSLYLIADGMGGHDNGVLASKIACDTLMEKLDFSLVREDSFEEYFKSLITAVGKEIYYNSEQKSEKRMGTTLTFLVIREGKAYMGHVGDTRVYRIENNELIQLTKDHSKIQQLLDRGEILEKDIDSHPLKNIIYSAVGYEETVKEIFTYKEDILPGRAYLLVSDGITRVLSHNEMLKEIKESKNLKESIQNMIKLAEKHGEDNATALGVEIKEYI